MKWEICKNWFFSIPKRYFFIPLKTISYPKFFFHTFQSLFHTLKTFFIPLYNNFIPCEIFFCYILCFHFIPSTSISYPDHGISYQVAKFSSSTQPISYSSHFPLISSPIIVYCIHSFTTERTSHVCGCFLCPNYVAQSSSAPTGWMWPAPTAPTCQASDALSQGSQAWSRLVSVLHAWTANSGAHTSSCVFTTSERTRHSLRPADHNRACTPPYSKF